MVTYKKISVFALFLILLSFLGCSTVSYEQLIPENYSPSYQSEFRANIIIAGGPKECMYGYPHEVTPTMFKKALMQSDRQIISEQDENQQYTIIVKNINCCQKDKFFTGKSYWALRNNSSQHIVWQKLIEETGSPGIHWYNPPKRIMTALTNCYKQTIVTGLTTLSKVDLVLAEEKIKNLSELWHNHRSADSFFDLYQYLLFSSSKKIERIRDGYRYEMQGNLLITFTRQYVNDLIGEADNILSGSGDNQTLEWVIQKDGKETVYRLSFYQNQLSGGSIKQQA